MSVMKHKILRRYLKSTHLTKEHTLKNCEVVIDGKSIFNDYLYKSSGCHYIYGCECDKYANYVKKRMSIFSESNVTCYVIFNGAMDADFEFRKKMHNKILRHRASINKNNVDKKYYDPIFVKDVHAEVLEELGIKYFICENDPKEALFTAAKRFNCPVITNKIDYCIYGVSCIPASSLSFDRGNKIVKCNIYEHEYCKSKLKLQNNLEPLFIALTDEKSDQFHLLFKLTVDRNNLVPSFIDWLNEQGQQKAENFVSNLLGSQKEKENFKNSFVKINNLIKPNHEFVVHYFLRKDNYWDIFENDRKWFEKAVAFRRILVPYVNLMHKDQFSGCWLLYDKNQDDALLAAIDIISYIHCILSNSEKSSITFIGRRSTDTCLIEIEKSWDNVSNSIIFETMAERCKLFGRKFFYSVDPFNLFLKETIPGFDHEVLFRLNSDCWMLVIALVYYTNKNRNFTKSAYSILLSYVVLSRVANGVRILNETPEDLIETGALPTYENCKLVDESIKQQELFTLKDLTELDHPTLHQFAEFQHCLQHLNYLNKICGEKLRCTKFRTTYNGTFIYNIYKIIRDEDDALEAVRKIIGSSYVFKWYKKLIFAFDKLLHSVMDEVDKMKLLDIREGD